MRCEGRREHKARSYHNIRRYFHPVGAILDSWATHVISLREITNQGVKEAINTWQGNAAGPGTGSATRCGSGDRDRSEAWE